MATPAADSPRGKVCPWWLVYSFDNPLRRLLQRPEPIVRPFVRPGDRCLDLGCGFGYFTIPMARLAGPSGTVVAVDLQAQNLARVRRRAERAGLAARIRLHRVEADALRLEGKFDFALAFWMVHEVPDQAPFLREVAAALMPGGRLAIVEPRLHVGREAFARTIATAERVGLAKLGDLTVSLSRGVLLENAMGPVA